MRVLLYFFNCTTFELVLCPPPLFDYVNFIHHFSQKCLIILLSSSPSSILCLTITHPPFSSTTSSDSSTILPPFSSLPCHFSLLPSHIILSPLPPPSHHSQAVLTINQPSPPQNHYKYYAQISVIIGLNTTEEYL
jgi:hypothetical protein